MGKKFSLNLCNKEFWNNFFSPRYPGVFIILVLVLVNTVYACTCVLMSAYFDNFSSPQHVGYFTLLIANCIMIVTGFLTIHFLTLRPSNTRISYCLFLHIGMLLATLLGISTVILMSSSPTADEIISHTERYVRIYHKAPYMMRNVFEEKQCCGIKKFGDIFPTTNRFPKDTATSGTKLKKRKFYRIPPSCCRKNVRRKCEEWVEDLIMDSDFKNEKDQYLNQQPCLKSGETFASIRQTKTFALYEKTLLCTPWIFGFIMGILAVLNYYIWYRFPRMPEDERPDQFNQDLRALVRCKFSQLRKSIKNNNQHQDQDTEAIIEEHLKKHPSDFAARHNMIMQSLANMRNLNREMRHNAGTNLIHLPGVTRSRSNTNLSSVQSRHILTAKSASKMNISAKTVPKN